ncbi:MAG: DUF2065 domain-containing protein [Gammaproteobacteria bacterium]
MQWSDLLTAFALFLVLEGLLPFVSPGNWRKSIAVVAQLKDGQLRFVGFVALALGLGLLLVVRGGA